MKKEKTKIINKNKVYKLIFIIEDKKKFIEEQWIRFLFSEIDENNIIFLSPTYFTNFIENLNLFDFPIFIFSENSKLSKQKIYLLKNYFFQYGLIHLSDEWFIADYQNLYNGASFVLRNYMNKALLNFENIYHIPIGFKITNLNNRKEKIKKIKKELFFKGELKGERFNMLRECKKSGIDVSNGSKTQQSYQKYMSKLKEYKFGLSPYGNTTPDTLRIYEYLECGVLPILGTKKAFDYFKLLFGEETPFFYDVSWTKVLQKFKVEKDNSKTFNSFKINTWWKKKKENYRLKCSFLISNNFDKSKKVKIYRGFNLRINSLIWLLNLQTRSMLIERFRKIIFLNGFYKIIKRILFY